MPSISSILICVVLLVLLAKTRSEKGAWGREFMSKRTRFLVTRLFSPLPNMAADTRKRLFEFVVSFTSDAKAKATAKEGENETF